MRIDVHQHLWSEPLVEALAARRSFPYVRQERGLAVLYLAGERPYVIDLVAEQLANRCALVERDGLDRALLCLSSPLGIEWLPRVEARPLIDAYHEGALSLGEPFGVWGAVALDAPQPDDVDEVLERGCLGVSMPAGALASVGAVAHVEGLLARLELLDAPLLIHPGPGPAHRAGTRAGAATLADPLWWPAMTSYVAGMQAAWLAFLVAGRARHPDLRVIFTMLGGLAPLQFERLHSRGGPSGGGEELIFYDTSSYGPSTVDALGGVVGFERLLYGSDRPVVEPAELGMPRELDWSPIIEATARALGAGRLAGCP
jgi:6-methylsalicylate decarboxylase